MRRISIPTARRDLQVALGIVWLLAAALQFQPFMFGRGFALEVLKPTAAGNPSLVARPVLWSAGLVLAHPVFWNTLFALTQLLLGLGLFWRRSVKAALAGTVAWSLIVWWLGEGMGGVLTGSPMPLMGAPGAVILYALLALLLWPKEGKSGGSLAETSIINRVAPVAWVLLWGSEAYFALLPANDSPSALHGMLAGMAGGEPQPIASLDRWLAGFAAGHGAVGPLIGALFALCAFAVLLPTRLAKPLYGLAMVLAAATWLGQDFGGILTGQGTDPNSGLLLFLLAVAYWPILPQTTREPVTASAYTRPPLVRAGIAVAAAALVGASSVAAATGLTTQTASATPQPTRLTATVQRTLGPGPIVNTTKLGGYQILFRDPVNRATHPSTLSVVLHHEGRTVRTARVEVTYHSMDMPMPARTLSLESRGHDYDHQGPLLEMGGRWRLTVFVSLPQGRQLQVRLTDLIAR
jgi:hypothetical protein